MEPGKETERVRWWNNIYVVVGIHRNYGDESLADGDGDGGEDRLTFFRVWRVRGKTDLGSQIKCTCFDLTTGDDLGR